MIRSRNKNITVMSQFNINGSRGADAGKFISDYVSRDSATEPSTAYRPDPGKPAEYGDGVAFTLGDMAISRQETLNIAEHVQDLHATGTRAIQQMVLSFSHAYLMDMNVIPEDIVVLKKGDYAGNYDDIRLRYAVRDGLQAMIDAEGYRDGKAIACIQSDTRHLHVHAVVYEDARRMGRVRGREEKGMIKESSFNQLAYNVDRHLSLTQTSNVVPTQNVLVPTNSDETEVVASSEYAVEPVYVNRYLDVIRLRQKVAARRAQQEEAKRRQRERAEELLQQEAEAKSVKKEPDAAIERGVVMNEMSDIIDDMADALSDTLLSQEPTVSNNPKQK